ncbi:hypothetical protein [Streptomyces sp. NPDC057686]|uniref:hypothetical protein n=1 Tax=Streptomyces sp. NPDC057686 TaxID=3346212 RepID=UPI0036B7CE23
MGAKKPDWRSKYTCGSCNSETSVGINPQGAPYVRIAHEDTCPVLAGNVSETGAIVRAIKAAHGDQTPVIVVTLDELPDAIRAALEDPDDQDRGEWS